jgi:cyanate lyase
LALLHTWDLKTTRAGVNELSPPSRDKGENGRLGTVEVAEAAYESSADNETATMEEVAVVWLRFVRRIEAIPRRSQMRRKEATERVLEAKREKGLTFSRLAEKVGQSKVWTTAALLGQHPMSAEEAQAACDVLGLGAEVAAALQEIPMRGSLDSDVPVDPTIYRIHEITQVYGTTIKALIHEEFGDGIMSAINFRMDLERVEHPEGDRVRITYEGKFLPYQW